MEFKTNFLDTYEDNFGQSLGSRTADGLEVVLEISFQYRLMPDKLYSLYRKFGVDYTKTLR